MDKIDTVRKIAANFLKVNEDAVSQDTLINNKTIKGSVMLHRMYAVLSKELGVNIKNYEKVKTFEDLLVICKLAGENTPTGGDVQDRTTKNVSPNITGGISIGIDIEEIDKMPKANDCREDIFYKQNFSPKEISYCLLQSCPWASFAGKFAAKEAVVKADNSYKGAPFSEIEIDHDVNGKPVFRNFAISITHNDKYAIAVVVAIRP